MCERDAKRLVNAVIIYSYTILLQAHRPTQPQRFVHRVYTMHTVKRTTITLREDQHEWVQEHHLNLSSFIRERLDEYIKDHE